MKVLLRAVAVGLVTKLVQLQAAAAKLPTRYRRRPQHYSLRFRKKVSDIGLTRRAYVGNHVEGCVEGEQNFHPSPRHISRDVASKRPPGWRYTILTLPPDLEELLERIDPDYLGYDATIHSETAYTIILLTLDYRYTAWRAVLGLSGRWTLSPLDWAGTFQLVTPDDDWP
jgi:hypothetical protein